MKKEIFHIKGQGRGSQGLPLYFGNSFVLQSKMGLLKKEAVRVITPQFLPESLFASGGFRCWNRMFRRGSPFIGWLNCAANNMIDGFLIRSTAPNRSAELTAEARSLDRGKKRRSVSTPAYQQAG